MARIKTGVESNIVDMMMRIAAQQRALQQQHLQAEYNARAQGWQNLVDSVGRKVNWRFQIGPTAQETQDRRIQQNRAAIEHGFQDWGQMERYALEKGHDTVHDWLRQEPLDAERKRIEFYQSEGYVPKGLRPDPQRLIEQGIVPYGYDVLPGSAAGTPGISVAPLSDAQLYENAPAELQRRWADLEQRKGQYTQSGIFEPNSPEHFEAMQRFADETNQLREDMRRTALTRRKRGPGEQAADPKNIVNNPYTGKPAGFFDPGGKYHEFDVPEPPDPKTRWSEGWRDPKNAPEPWVNVFAEDYNDEMVKFFQHIGPKEIVPVQREQMEGGTVQGVTEYVEVPYTQQEKMELWRSHIRQLDMAQWDRWNTIRTQNNLPPQPNPYNPVTAENIRRAHEDAENVVIRQQVARQYATMPKPPARQAPAAGRQAAGSAPQKPLFDVDSNVRLSQAISAAGPEQRQLVAREIELLQRSYEGVPAELWHPADRERLDLLVKWAEAIKRGRRRAG